MKGGMGGVKEYHYSPSKASPEPPGPCISRSLSFLCLASENALDPLMNLFLDYIGGGREGKSQAPDVSLNLICEWLLILIPLNRKS